MRRKARANRRGFFLLRPICGHEKLATRTGFEPVIFSLTGRCVKPGYTTGSRCFDGPTAHQMLERSSYTVITDNDQFPFDHHWSYPFTTGEAFNFRDQLGKHAQVDLLVLDPVLFQIVQKRVGVGAIRAGIHD